MPFRPLRTWSRAGRRRSWNLPEWDLRPRLREIRVPTLIRFVALVWGFLSANGL